jgi:hypothetical protein
MKFVATRTIDQLDLQAMHRARERLVSQRTSIINQIRLAVAQSPSKRLDNSNTATIDLSVIRHAPMAGRSSSRPLLPINRAGL